MTFKELFKIHREAAGLSKSDVARHLNRTDAYIRKLENLGYTPPTYDICCQLVTLFNLQDSERRAFLQAAFQERLHENGRFYQDVHQQNGLRFDLDDNQEYLSQLRFCIVFQTKFNTPLLDDSRVQAKLQQIIQSTCTDFNHTITEIDIHPNQVSFVLHSNAETEIVTFVKGLKTLSSDQLRQQFPELTTLPTLWANRFGVFTIGEKPNVSTETLLNSTPMSMQAALTYDD